MITSPLRRIFRGASALMAGGRGLVPTPAAGDQDKQLHGDATWRASTSASSATTTEAIAGTDTTKWLSPATGAAAIANSTSSRQVRDCVISNGADTNRRIEWTLGAAGAVAGLPISIPFEFDAPPSNPATSAVIASFCLGGSSSGTAYELRVYIGTSGELAIRQFGATTSDFRSFYWAAFRTTYSGVKGLRGMVVFENGDTTTAPKIYIQGVDVSASFSLTTGGTVPNWMPLTLDATKFLSGYNWPAGRFVPHAPILGALTAAEVLEWTQTGRLPTWCEIAAGHVAKYTSNFSTAGLDGWIANRTVALSNQDGVSDGTTSKDDCVLIYADGSNNSHNFYQASQVELVAGALYRLDFDYYIPSGQTNVNGIYLETASEQAFTTLAVSNFNNASVVGAWTHGSITFLLTNAGVGVLSLGLRKSGVTNYLGANSPSDDRVYMRAVIARVGGPLFRPVIQACRIIDDAGSNGIPGVLTTGITPITTKKDWRMRATVDMSTTGNKQLFGAAVFESPTAHAIDTIEADCTGTPTVNGIGDGTTATRYAGSHALSAGRSRLTLSSTPFPADSAKTGLYANVTVTGGTSEKLIIRGHRID